MNRHIFKTTLEGRPVDVVTGWDRCFNGYYLYIRPVDNSLPEADQPDFLFSNLATIGSHPKVFDAYEEILSRFGIKLPESMMTEVRADGEMKAADKEVLHQIIDGKYVRIPIR